MLKFKGQELFFESSREDKIIFSLKVILCTVLVAFTRTNHNRTLPLPRRVVSCKVQLSLDQKVIKLEDQMHSQQQPTHRKSKGRPLQNLKSKFSSESQLELKTKEI